VPSHHLIHQLAVSNQDAVATLVEDSRSSEDPAVLVAAALFAGGDGDALLARAAALAASTRDRQLVSIAAAFRRGERSRVDALARDHLVDHPGSVLVAWMADASHHRIEEDA
jgi:hypothetical protein